MSELEDKLSAVLSNPQMMQQIMTLAQSMGASQPKPQQEPQPESPSEPNFDPALLNKLAGMASQGRVDSREEALLSALTPYLSPSRVNKLERAMRAAKIAGAASAFLGSGGLQMLTGR